MSILTKEQSVAYDAIMKWAKGGMESGWIFTLAGFAGTGKTYLLQHIIQSLDKKPVCCAPTGKAASVLQGKLEGIQVTTIHRILYSPRHNSTTYIEQLIAGERSAIDSEDEQLANRYRDEITEEKKKLAEKKVTFDLKAESNRDAKEGVLVIVDEASMVDPEVKDDLEATGAKILFVGDGGQLDPVMGKSWFSKRIHDATLEEIQRQALDSPIIRLSMAIREGSVKKSDYADSECDAQIVDRVDFDPEEWVKANQVITGKNSSRHRLNRWLRKGLGYFEEEGDELPKAGEKLICLKNDYAADPPRVNGMQFLALEDGFVDDEGVHRLSIDYEGHLVAGAEFYDYHCRVHYDKTIPEEPREFRRGMMELDFGHCITAHKSQGSEWEYVIVADDKMMAKDRKFRQKWLYTAVTRAQKKVTIVQ